MGGLPKAISPLFVNSPVRSQSCSNFEIFIRVGGLEAAKKRLQFNGDGSELELLSCLSPILRRTIVIVQFEVIKLQCNSELSDCVQCANVLNFGPDQKTVPIDFLCAQWCAASALVCAPEESCASALMVDKCT